MRTTATLISIHAPRGGSDIQNKISSAISKISIHAPRGGSDHRCLLHRHKHSDFNPRSPWGERRARPQGQSYNTIFQSTLPVGGATTCWMMLPMPSMISIHAPRGGSDPVYIPAHRRQQDFNPRSPWGERRAIPGFDDRVAIFQSTLPVGGATTHRR